MGNTHSNITKKEKGVDEQIPAVKSRPDELEEVKSLQHVSGDLMVINID